MSFTISLPHILRSNSPSTQLHHSSLLQPQVPHSSSENSSLPIHPPSRLHFYSSFQAQFLRTFITPPSQDKQLPSPPTTHPWSSPPIQTHSLPAPPAFSQIFHQKTSISSPASTFYQDIIIIVIIIIIIMIVPQRLRLPYPVRQNDVQVRAFVSHIDSALRSYQNRK